MCTFTKGGRQWGVGEEEEVEGKGGGGGGKQGFPFFTTLERKGIFTFKEKILKSRRVFFLCFFFFVLP